MDCFPYDVGRRLLNGKQIMSNFIQHESCPRCKSKDNLARYTDNSAFCFSQGCGYFEKANGETVHVKKKL